MTIFDIIILVTTLAFVIAGLVKGFIKTLLGLGATLLAIVVARSLGGYFGRTLFGDLISRRSPLANNMSSATLKNVNESLATLLGAILTFLVIYVILRIVVRFVSKRIKGSRTGMIDRLLGAALGLILALGAIYTLACLIDIVAILLSLFGSSYDVYSEVDSSQIFKYFF